MFQSVPARLCGRISGSTTALRVPTRHVRLAAVSGIVRKVPPPLFEHGCRFFSSTEDSFKVIEISFGGNGRAKRTNLHASEILRRTSILPRDLVSLNLTARRERYDARRRRNFNARPPTAILPRTDSILLSFGNVRAVVSRELVLLLDAHRPIAKEFGKDLSVLLNSLGSHKDPPELIFLEAVLKDTCETFARRIGLYEPIVNSFVGRIDQEVFSYASVHQLVPLKDSLQSFELQVQQCYECLTNLLNDDEEMLNLLLTEQAEARLTGVPVDFDRHQHVELMLGVYARQLNNTLLEIQYLLKRLQSKQEFVTLALAGYRNRLVKVNVNVGIAGVSIGLATAVAGFFGMNVINGLETAPHAFGFIVGLSCASSAVVSGLSLNYLSGRAMQKRAEERLGEIETLTKALSDMSALDYTVVRMVEGKETFSKKAFQASLQEARQARHKTDVVSDQEAEFLFNILDTSKDEQLSSDDLPYGNKSPVGSSLKSK